MRLPERIRRIIVDTDAGGRNIRDHIAAISERLPPSERWRLILEEDRRNLANEIATEGAPEDDANAACRKWGDSFQTKQSLTFEEVKEKLTKTDKPLPIPLNAYLILTFDSKIAGTIRWNDYAKKVEISHGPLAGFDDMETTVSQAQNWIATKYGVTIARNDIGYQITLVAQNNSHNPLHDYLFGLAWDNNPRIDRLFVDYFGAEDTPHNRRISRRWALGCISRALPHETWCTADGKKMGSKFDNIAILESFQGERKTSAWEVLGGRFYCSTAIAVADKDAKMAAASNWFIDSPELASFKKAETEVVKAVTTTRTDTYRAPYGRGIIHTARHCVTMSSTNDEHYLPDSTGNRRYWCLSAKRVDIPALMRDRDQIWAEAVAVFLGEMSCSACHTSTDTVAGQRPRCQTHRWWLDKDEESVAAEIVSTREMDQPWMIWRDKIEFWWKSMSREKRPEILTAGQIAETVGRLGATDRVTSSVLTAIGVAMARLGFIRNPNKRCYTPSDMLRAMPHVPAPQGGSLFENQGTVVPCKCDDCTIPPIPDEITPVGHPLKVVPK